MYEDIRIMIENIQNKVRVTSVIWLSCLKSFFPRIFFWLCFVFEEKMLTELYFCLY